MIDHWPLRIPYLTVRSVKEAYVDERISVTVLEREVERILIEGEPRDPTKPEFR